MIEHSGSPELPPILSEPPPPRVSRWRWVAVLCVLAFYVMGLGLLGSDIAPVTAGGPAPKKGPLLPASVDGLLALTTMELLVFFVVLLAATALCRWKPADLLLPWRGGIAPLWRGFLYSLALRIGVGIVLLAGTMLFVASTASTPEEAFEAVRPKTEAIISSKAVSSPLYLALCMTLVSFVLAGLREELWRAGILAALRQLYPARFGTLAGQYRAVLVAATIFGLGHLAQGWGGALATMLLGAGLGAIMVRHQSIWDAVLAHGFFNATTFALLYLISRLDPSALPPGF